MRNVIVTGVDEIQRELRQLGLNAVDEANKQMRKAANNIVETAKKYVPKDSSALKNSIRVKADWGCINGRLQLGIVVGGQIVDRNNSRASMRGVNLDQYALIAHENYHVYKTGYKL